jgi:nucleoside-diphosphate-sugar epimerase
LGIGRIIFVSTVAIYGLQSGAVDETSPPHPFNVYGQSKLQAEEVLRAWWTRDTRSRVLEIIRLPAVFGPGNRGNVYNLVSQVARGHFVMVGSGRNRKSMAYVGNVAAFLTHLVNESSRSGSRLYNYCDKPDLSMNELLRIARRALRRRATPSLRLPVAIGLMIASCFDILAWATRKNFAISRVRVRKFCAHTVFESQLMRETRFEPPFALEDALERTIAEEFTGRP